ncbi:LOW QUALITY PROTEIN: uncharacterized protein LOC125037576 [Penaeus chinensis]|uniref:LOW QUALITY PROTEIN: uncharacterized protein LOC125037576 n=1 Tax=Penaeus chinensis TaxID=139456 RepID=UPI001FB648DE|nr:LOW QUALITY PROTEIN: uncharacterized protein LOC125037576 [Penaeus chinensis]
MMKTLCGENGEGNGDVFLCPEELEDFGVSLPPSGLLQEFLIPGSDDNNSRSNDTSNSDRDSEEASGGDSEGNSDIENNNERKDWGCNRNNNNNNNSNNNDNKSHNNSKKGSHSNKSNNSCSINASDDSDTNSNSNNNNNSINNNEIETRCKNGNSFLASNYNKQNGVGGSEPYAAAGCPSAMCKSDECCLQSPSCDSGEGARRGRECTEGCVGAKGAGGLRASQNTINNNSDWSGAVAKCPKAFSSNGCAAGIHADAGDSSGHVRHRGGTAKVLNSGMNLSPRMKELLQGLNEPGDSGNPPEPPDWLDRRLFNRGRQFYGRFLFCIFFSDLLALLMMFTVSRILRPLIYTGRSDTPQRALRRYVSTILHVVTWYRGDVWDPQDPAHRDILSVRAIHDKSARVLNSSTDHEKVSTVDVRARGHDEPRCPFQPRHKARPAPPGREGPRPGDARRPTAVHSQWDMLITQYSFLGVLVAHPRSMGAWWASEEDLAGLIHFWRGIGWLLGVEDKYNFCNGSLADTRVLCLEMERHLIVPGFAAADWSHEHMATSLVTGINHMVPCLSYPAMLRFLADTLGVHLPSFVRQMSLRHTFQYWLMRFVFHVLFLIPGVLFLFNELLLLALRIIQKKNPAWRLKSERYNVKSFPHVYA